MTQPTMGKKEKKEKKHMLYTQLSLAQTLTPELLTLIFEAVVADEHADRKVELREKQGLVGQPDDTAFDSVGDSFAGDSTVLLSASLVCKSWHLAAQPLLPAAITFALTRNSRAAALFLSAIHCQPTLAPQVKSLAIVSDATAVSVNSHMDPHPISPMAFCHLCLAIMSCCPNVEQLKAVDIGAGTKEALLAVVASLQRLRLIQIQTKGLADHLRPSLVDLLNLRRGAQALEVISLFGGTTLSSNVFEEAEDFLQPPASRPFPFDNISFHSDLTLTAHGCHIRELELDDVSLMDQQFIILMGHVAPTLKRLSIVGSPPSPLSYFHRPLSTSAICRGLAKLQALEHLYLDLKPATCAGSLFAPSIAPGRLLVAPLHRLQTVYATRDVLPFSGLGHLASLELRHLHFLTEARTARTNIDQDDLVASVKEMLQRPDKCPQALSISHVLDNNAEDFDAIRAVDEQVVAHLTELCDASDVAFSYKSYFT